MNLQPFGKYSQARRQGYSLGFFAGWLEDMIGTEADCEMSMKGPKMKRLSLVEDALNKLQEAIEMGGDECL